MIAFSCAHCGMKFLVRPEFAGRPAHCPTCRENLIVPAVSLNQGSPPTASIDGPSSTLVDSGVNGGISLQRPDGAGVSLSNHHPTKSIGSRRRYEVEGEIARGGMGAVLRALDYDLRREVAIKVLIHHTDPNKQRRFVDEAQITGQLEHPNIVPVHELGVDGQKRPYFTMKMVHGRSLAQVLNRLREDRKIAEKEYTLGQLLNIFVGVCNALAYAHSRGVVHRDLKPSNIMLGDFGEVYVMDWGIAKILGAESTDPTPETSPPESPPTGLPLGRVLTAREPEADLTEDGAIVGTPVYMSPEQARGRVNDIDRRSDVYALGAVLYEMLTLRPPFDSGGDYLDLLMRVAHGEVPPPEKRAPQRARAGKIPRELAAVAMKALARNPDDRYPSVEELRRDIERFQEGRAVSAKDDTRWEQAIKFAKRNRGLTAATVAAFSLLAVVLGFSLHINLQARLDANQLRGELEKQREVLRIEQKLRLDREQQSIPAFVRAACLAVSEHQFAEAQTNVQMALGFDPQNPEARLLNAQLLLVPIPGSPVNLAGAGLELDKYPDGRKETPTVRRFAELCRRGRPDQPADLLAIVGVLQELKSLVIAEQLAHLRDKMLQERKEKLPKFAKQIETLWPAHASLTLDADGAFHLTVLPGPLVIDLDPLRNIPLSSLVLHNCRPVRDLGPLQGMPLTKLDLGGCVGISDLGPLHGMPLKWLDLSTCSQIKDFKALKGLPLEHLDLSGCSFPDLKILQGLPLSRLTLMGCRQLQDLGPLHGLSISHLDVAHCALLQDLSPLRGLPLTSLTLSGCQLVTDLMPLRDLPIQQLDLTACSGVTDLRPLHNMPLASLTLDGMVHLRNLTPLKGKTLTAFSIEGCTEIKDLAILRGMPLVSLNIAGSGVTDLTPLEGMRLQDLKWTPATVAVGLDKVRTMPTLKNIQVGLAKWSAEEFWKKFDAGEFKK